ncbi:MAG TPA: hypothetical protein VMR86_08005 [Myxococcota bacterium]|nr:hypothetical protein [Myxococcota bacterium]
MSEDRRWIETLREQFQPEPVPEARAAEQRRALRQGLTRPARGPRIAWPALAAAMAAAALYLALPRATPTTPGDAGASLAESDALVDPDAYASELAGDPGYLPADYQGLALLLDDDAADR